MPRSRNNGNHYGKIRRDRLRTKRLLAALAELDRDDERKGATIREMIAQSAEGKFHFSKVIAKVHAFWPQPKQLFIRTKHMRSRDYRHLAYEPKVGS